MSTLARTTTMTRRWSCLPIALLILPLVAHAQWSTDEGEQLPDTPWRKSSGDFATMLLITGDLEALLDEWKRSGATDDEAEVETTSRVGLGETVAAAIVFSGCTAGEDGNCDSETDFRVIAPDGSVYAKFERAELWKDKPAPAADSFRVGVANLELAFEPSDPVGTYRIEATTRDNLGHVVLELVQDLEVVGKDTE